jgi:hypothetical protein
MVNTLFAGKVMFVNQPIVMLGMRCRRLAEDGVKWLEKLLEYRELKQTIEGLSLTFIL